MKSVIVTGAASMIGRAVISEALARGMKAVAVVRSASPRNKNLDGLRTSENLEIIERNIDDYKNLTFKDKYDAFLHLAWHNTNVAVRDDVYSQIDNITYTMDAFHAAKRAGCESFTLAGSQAEYGLTADKLSSNTPCNPESGYGIAKYAAGKMSHLLSAQLGIRFCHARILSVYGEYMPENSLIMYVIKTMLEGNSPSLTKCEQMWDYIYVKDAAKALLAIAENGKNKKAYPVGSGLALPLKGYIETIRDIINLELEPGFGEREYYPHQPMYLCADITDLRNDTGFEPKFSFDEGVRETIKWYTANRR
jgi:nucleoside-diphosphate-sugar epimerase